MAADKLVVSAPVQTRLGGEVHPQAPGHEDLLAMEASLVRVVFSEPAGTPLGLSMLELRDEARERDLLVIESICREYEIWMPASTACSPYPR